MIKVRFYYDTIIPDDWDGSEHNDLIAEGYRLIQEEWQDADGVDDFNLKAEIIASKR